MKNCLFVISISFTFCCFFISAGAQEKVLYDPSYKPAMFADPDRMEKIKRSFAAIDSIYKNCGRW
jgi:hypothetical protein